MTVCRVGQCHFCPMRCAASRVRKHTYPSSTRCRAALWERCIQNADGLRIYLETAFGNRKEISPPPDQPHPQPLLQHHSNLDHVYLRALGCRAHLPSVTTCPTRRPSPYRMSTDGLELLAIECQTASCIFPTCETIIGIRSVSDDRAMRLLSHSLDY